MSCLTFASPFDVTVTDSAFEGCSARELPELVFGHFRSGAAALHLDRINSLQLSGSSFTRNKNSYGAPSAIFLEASTTASVASLIRDTTFESNIAQLDVTIRALSPLGFLCRLGSWMHRTGDFYGNLSAPDCYPCAAGSFGRSRNLTDRSCSDQCPDGHFCGEGTFEPTPCAPGTVSPTRGQSACSFCPHPLSSARGSARCSICMRGFYLRPRGPQAAFSAEDCQACPPHADCSSFNTTLRSLGVDPGFWRASTATSRLYACDDSDTCIGSGGATRGLTPRHLDPSNSSVEKSPYCAEGHSGPLCKLCLDDDHYFSGANGRCVACPDLSTRFAIFAAVAGGAAIVLAGLYMATLRISACGAIAQRLRTMLASTGIQAKGKIVISFFQVCSSLSSVYGVRLHSGFSGLLSCGFIQSHIASSNPRSAAL